MYHLFYAVVKHFLSSGLTVAAVAMTQRDVSMFETSRLKPRRWLRFWQMNRLTSCRVSQLDRVSVQAGWDPLSSWYLNQMWTPPPITPLPLPLRKLSLLQKTQRLQSSDVWLGGGVARSELLIALNASDRFPGRWFLLCLSLMQLLCWFTGWTCCRSEKQEDLYEVWCDGDEGGWSITEFHLRASKGLKEYWSFYFSVLW